MSFADMTTRSADVAAGDGFTRSVHALFDHRAEADKAHQDLIAAGILQSAITLTGQEVVDPVVAPPADEGFWDRLIAFFIPEDDRHSYAEGLRRGGIAVVVRTDTANYDRVIEILDRDGAIDLDERQESWRRDGWSGYTGPDPLADAKSPSLSFASAEEEPTYAKPSDATAGFAASAADHFPVVPDHAPPIESPGAVPPDMLEGTPDHQYPAAAPGLRAPDADAAEPSWLRDTSHGRTRVRSYVNAPAGIDPQI